MATVNLGAIKFNWKGAYNNSTAYVVDDVVSSGGSSYVCILASQGNAVSNGTYWSLMAQAGTNGTNGTNGTDVGTVITTQGDILYRDGSGLQRLAKGTAAQVLKMNTAANAPEWGTLSSDFVKLASVNTSGVTEVNFDNYFTSDYDNYKFIGSFNPTTNGDRIECNPRQSGSNLINNKYEVALYGYKQDNDTNATISTDGRINANEPWRMGWGRTNNVCTFEVTINDPLNTTLYKMGMYECASRDNNYYYRRSGTVSNENNANAYTGWRFLSSGNNATFKITLYGLKK